MQLFVGTYSNTTDLNNPKPHGICRVDFDPETGEFGKPEVAASALNASYLGAGTDFKTLFAVRETMSVDEPALLTFAVDAKAGLTPLSRVAMPGELPCHLAYDATNMRLVSAQYGTGDVLICAATEGKLHTPVIVKNTLKTGPFAPRQDGPHAHFVTFSDAGDVLHAVDLGTDSITSYRLNAENAVIETAVTQLPPGCGPRHMVLNAAETRAYLLCELDETLIALDRSDLGWEVTERVAAFPPPDDKHGSCAAIRLSGDESHVFVSGRRQSEIACFAVSGGLHRVGAFASGGKTPRDFILTRDGRWIIAANQDTDNLVSFRYDAEAGRFEPSGHQCAIFKPVSVLEWVV